MYIADTLSRNYLTSHSDNPEPSYEIIAHANEEK